MTNGNDGDKGSFSDSSGEINVLWVVTLKEGGGNLLGGKEGLLARRRCRKKDLLT